MSSVFTKRSPINMNQFEMRDPYLIQRGIFEPDPYTITGIDSIARLDYMGSSEFEWGALPLSLRDICHNLDDYHIMVMDDIKNIDGQALHVMCHKNFDKQIQMFVHGLNDRTYRLKEASYFPEHIAAKDPYYLQFNLWWDILNHYMFFFGLERVQLVQQGITKLRERWVAEKVLALQ